MKRHFLFVFIIIFLCGVYLSAQQLIPGDGVRVTFFNITDAISGDYYVQNDGRIQLPYIGVLAATQKDFLLIKTEILSKYDSLYRDPEITVQPLYKINILGEVKTPGYYYVTGVEKLSDLLAQAGGETSDADLNSVFIMREHEEIEVDAEKIIQDGNKLSDIGLKSGDKIFVSRQWWVGARNTAFIISAVAAVITVVALFVR